MMRDDVRVMGTLNRMTIRRVRSVRLKGEHDYRALSVLALVVRQS